MKAQSLKVFLAVFTLIGLLSVTACHKDEAKPAATTYTISGSANGSQVVPANAATGTATITGVYTPSTGMLTFTVNWTGLTGAPASGGFFAGASGVTGTAMGTAWNFGTAPAATGSISGQMTLTSDQAAALTSGGWYYSIGTTSYPGGEVRGQITTIAQ
jgi:hypothetical protein